jgi:pimeloyl-ACP methyl ester carboxylesterase
MVPAEADLWSNEYWAVKQRDGYDIRLAMYRKRLGAPQSGEAPRPVLFLVHGSSGGAKSSFDLTVPGHGEYSTMNVFARAGFDVWTMDHEGYGKSSRTDGNSDIASGVEDLKAAIEVVAHETGQTRCAFMGSSSGAIRAGAFAMVAPDRVNGLLLAAFTYTGKSSPTLTKRAESLEYYRTHNRRLRDRAMIESIFTRDRPGTTDPAVPAAMADAELVYGDTVPTGTYLDMTSNLPLVDPTKVTCPVCILRGEYDGISTNEDLWDFFRQLPNGNRQFVIIAGAAHALGTSNARMAFWHAMQAFLTLPPA